jgi:undecaprenyl-diphosphatase
VVDGVTNEADHGILATRRPADDTEAVLLNRPTAFLGAVPVIGLAFLLDAPAQRWAARVQTHVADMFVGLLNPIGSGVTLLVLCMTLAILCRARGHGRACAAGWWSALAFVVAGLAEYALKYLVGRPRPAVGVAFEFDSFPSGHATSVFAVAAVLGAFYPRLRWPLYAVAAAIALGRVYLARHYLSDIVAGALIGLVVASLLLRHRSAISARTAHAA